MNNLDLPKSAPFIHKNETAINLHLDLLVGLVSVLIISVVQNGLRVLVISVASVLAAWLTETIGLMILRNNRRNDLRSIAMGLIIALISPISVPFWLPISASVFSVLLVRVILSTYFKKLFVTPVIAWLYMLSIAPGEMTKSPVERGFDLYPIFNNFGEDVRYFDSLAQQLQRKQPLYYDFFDIFTGDYPGGAGTTCIFIIFAICIYFIFRKSMAWQVSISMIITVAVIATIFNRTVSPWYYSVLYELSAGAYIFVAVFVAGDLINAPMLRTSKVIYGVLIGILTMLLRFFGLADHSVPLALLVVNLFCDWFDFLSLYLQMKFKKISNTINIS